MSTGKIPRKPRAEREVEDAEVERTIPIVVSVMENAAMPALDMKVPLKVDARAATNWDEAH